MGVRFHTQNTRLHERKFGLGSPSAVESLVSQYVPEIWSQAVGRLSLREDYTEECLRAASDYSYTHAPLSHVRWWNLCIRISWGSLILVVS